MTNNDPAYPTTLDTRDGLMEFSGLTKRELFAAMAMQGFASDPQCESPGPVAAVAVKWADALLAELAKDQP